jgi:hypothetical protein
MLCRASLESYASRSISDQLALLTDTSSIVTLVALVTEMPMRPMPVYVPPWTMMFCDGG